MEIIQLTSMLPCMSYRTGANSFPNLSETQIRSCHASRFAREAREGPRSTAFDSSPWRFEVKVENREYAPTVRTTSRAACKNFSVFILSSIISGNCTVSSDSTSIAQASSRTVESEDDMFYYGRIRSTHFEINEIRHYYMLTSAVLYRDFS